MDTASVLPAHKFCVCWSFVSLQSMQCREPLRSGPPSMLVLPPYVISEVPHVLCLGHLGQLSLTEPSRAAWVCLYELTPLDRSQGKGLEGCGFSCFLCLV